MIIIDANLNKITVEEFSRDAEAVETQLLLIFRLINH
jgi:hypothetical protein